MKRAKHIKCLQTKLKTMENRTSLITELREKWAVFARQKKLNSTRQRDLIIEQFLKTRDHVSVEDLLTRVRKENSKIGHATVYRTLKLLVESGVAMERNFGDGFARFEVAGEHHDHLICTECGKIIEFEDDEIERLQEQLAKRHGFLLERHRHELYGKCQDCH